MRSYLHVVQIFEFLSINSSAEFLMMVISLLICAEQLKVRENNKKVINLNNNELGIYLESKVFIIDEKYKKSLGFLH